MKTTIQILTVIFVMNFAHLFAGDPKHILVKDNVNTASISLNKSELVPLTPKESFFNDIVPRPVNEISRLAPITPKEATFEDSKADFNIQSTNSVILQKIAPETPKEAEFDDSPIFKTTRIDFLGPFAPFVAPFED
jgi:hypothetical protein